MNEANEDSKRLREAVDAYNGVHDSWSAAGESQPVPTARYWDALESMFDAFRGTIPADCRAMLPAVGRLVEEFGEFDASGEAYPEGSFWAAREALVKARFAIDQAPESHRPPETIAELAALPGMTHRQIAQMYGFLDERGNVQTQLVQQELDTPGSVITSDWVHPEDKLVSQEDQQIVDSHRRLMEMRDAEAEVPCPESPQELFGQGVEVPQAARMLILEEDVVEEMWRTFKSEAAPDLPTRDLPPPQELPATTELTPADSPIDGDYTNMDRPKLMKVCKQLGITTTRKDTSKILLGKLRALEGAAA